MSDDSERDGLSDFSLEQIGMKTGAFGGARIIKYVTDHFTTREGETIEPVRELTVLDLVKCVQKFVGQKLVESTVVRSGQKMPDIAAMNEAAPREEWGQDLNGNPVGPFVRVLALKMLDMVRMDRFVFVTSSIGGSIAVGDLSDKCKMMRRLRGPNVVPVVSCCTTNFKTKFGTRKRPDFRVVRWIMLHGDGSGGLPQPEPPKVIGPGSSTPVPAAAKPAETTPVTVQNAPPPAGCRRQAQHLRRHAGQRTNAERGNGRGSGSLLASVIHMSMHQVTGGAAPVLPFPERALCAHFTSTPRPAAPSTSTRSAPTSMRDIPPPICAASLMALSPRASAARLKHGGRAIRCRQLSLMPPLTLTP
jgi:hypothetical protein